MKSNKEKKNKTQVEIITKHSNKPPAILNRIYKHVYGKPKNVFVTSDSKGGKT